MTSPAAQAVERERFEALLDEYGTCVLNHVSAFDTHKKLLAAYDASRAESRTAEQGAAAWRWCETKFGGEDWRYSETGPNPHRLCEPLYLAPPTVAAATRAAFLKAAQVIRALAKEEDPTAPFKDRDQDDVVWNDAIEEAVRQVKALTDALPAEAPEGREDRPDWQKQRREDESAYAEYSIPYGAQNTRQGIDIWRAALHWERARAASTEAAAVARGDMTMPEYVAAVNRSRQPAASEREVELPPLPQRIGGWGLTEITMFRAKAGRDKKRVAFEALLTHVQSKSIPLGDTQWIGLRDALLKAFDAALAQATPQAPEGE